MAIEMFCNWDHDLVSHQDETIKKLKAAGAVRAILMSQPVVASDRGLRIHGDRVRRFAARLADEGIALTLMTGLGVLDSDEPLRCRDRLELLARELCVTPMLDAEPHGGMHWSPDRLAPWLEIQDLQITTTRREAPRIGAHGRVTYMQLEGQESTATIGHALGIFQKYAPRERIIPVVGTFDAPGDTRTIDEVRTDLERCEAQAKLSGVLAAWVAQTTSLAEAQLMREWAAETWA